MPHEPGHDKETDTQHKPTGGGTQPPTGGTQSGMNSGQTGMGDRTTGMGGEAGIPDSTLSDVETRTTGPGQTSPDYQSGTTDPEDDQGTPP